MRNNFTPFGKYIVKSCIDRDIELTDVAANLGLNYTTFSMRLKQPLLSDARKYDIICAVGCVKHFSHVTYQPKHKYSPVGKAALKRMVDLNLTQGQLAAILGVSKNSVNYTLCGHHSYPGVLQKVCDYLEIPSHI